MFNAPDRIHDPAGGLPLGYFITRILAGDPSYTSFRALGGYIEIIAGSLTRGGEGRDHNIHVLKTVGAEHAFVGSDSGLTGTPNHPDALAMAAGVLREEGFRAADLDLLFKSNPAYLLGLDE